MSNNNQTWQNQSTTCTFNLSGVSSLFRFTFVGINLVFCAHVFSKTERPMKGSRPSEEFVGTFDGRSEMSSIAYGDLPQELVGLIKKADVY